MTPTEKQQDQTELSISLPVNLKEVLDQAAVMEGVDLQSLIIRYLEEGVEQIMPKLKREKYFNHLRQVMAEHNVPLETIKTLEDNFEY